MTLVASVAQVVRYILHTALVVNNVTTKFVLRSTRLAGSESGIHSEMIESSTGFAEPIHEKITIKVRRPRPPDAAPGTKMPFVPLDLKTYNFAELAFVNIGSFGGGRIRTDQVSVRAKHTVPLDHAS